MGRLRLAQAACGFWQRALSGFFIDVILVRHFDRGAVLDWRARESLRGDSRKCDWTVFRALLTPAVVVSFCANAQKAFRIPKYKGFCNARAVAWKPNAAGEAVRVANSPCGDHTISVDVWRGDSITVTTTLFSVRADECSGSGIGRSDRSIRCESRRGKGKAGECGAHASIGGRNGTFR
jgi:hypothetical protein